MRGVQTTNAIRHNYYKKIKINLKIEGEIYNE